MSKQRRAELHGLISRYMAGELSRRDFLRHVGVLVAAATASVSGAGELAPVAGGDSEDSTGRG